MAGFRANVVRAYNDGVSTLSLNEQVTGNYTANLSVSVPNLGPSTYTNYLWNLKRADVQAICITAVAALTILTNSSSAPTDTINLVAGQCLVWTLQTDAIGDLPFSADVTAGIFVANNSGAASQLDIRAICNY
jgi:hypothetical protein